MRFVWTLLVVISLLNIGFSMYVEKSFPFALASEELITRQRNIDAESKSLTTIQIDSNLEDPSLWYVRQDLETAQNITKLLPYEFTSLRCFAVDKQSNNSYLGLWRTNNETGVSFLDVAKISAEGEVLETITLITSDAEFGKAKQCGAVVGSDGFLYITTHFNDSIILLSVVNAAEMILEANTTSLLTVTGAVTFIRNYFYDGVLYVYCQDTLTSISAFPELSKLGEVAIASVASAVPFKASSTSSPVMYTIDDNGNTLNIIDLATMNVTATLSFNFTNSNPTLLTVKDYQPFFYVYNRGTIYKYRTSSYERVEALFIEIATGAYAMDVSSDGESLYLMDYQMLRKIVNGCAPGTFVSSDYCTDCAAGSFSSGYNQANCTACPRGFYSGSKSAECTACNRGFYADEYGSVACKHCNPGTFAANAGSSSCELCPRGTYNNVAGWYFCQNCDSGYSSVNGSTSCQACAAGAYAPKAGSPECLLCPVGTFSAIVASSNCTECKTATEPGQTTCSTGGYTDPIITAIIIVIGICIVVSLLGLVIFMVVRNARPTGVAATTPASPSTKYQKFGSSTAPMQNQQAGYYKK